MEYSTRQFNIQHFLYRTLPVIMLIAVSCTVPRKYQADKPFVFKTNIEVLGNIKTSERQDLETRLPNQLDDSLKTRIISFAGIRKTLIKPAVFDTNYANRSVLFMNELLNSLGYYRAQITWDSTLKQTGRQQRVTIDFTVTPGKNLRMDSVGFALTDSSLQALTAAHSDASLLEINQPYSQQIVAAELDRLIEVYKDNGFYKISKEDVYAEVDTVVAGLINPNLDPFEQIRLLNELRQKSENPTIHVVMKQRTKPGSVHLKKYFIRNVSIYPDLNLFEDSVSNPVDSFNINGIHVYSKDRKFKPSFLAKNSSLLPGNLFRQTDFYNTTNTFSQLGAWQQVNIDIQPDDSLGVLDITINLYPAKKQSLIIDLEATRNSGDVIATSNLFGVGLNIGLRNRNLARESIQSTTNVRGGVELGTKTRLVQTLQGSVAQTIYFPKFIVPFFKVKGEDRLKSSRTILNFNTSYTDRRDFFTLGSINGSIGYEWAKKKHVWFYSPFNIELVRLGLRDSLENLFDSIPNLRFSFNNGLIIGQNLVYRTVYSSSKNKLSSVKLTVEESGLLTGIIKHIDRDAGLYRYIKLDAEYRHLIRFERSAWAFRAYGGVGIPYGRQINGNKEPSLPFFKSFFAGGANSMRAWQVRRLGPGSSDTLQQYDRYGDITLEGNVEYRFNVATIGGIKIKSALFSDVGNIWNRSDYNNPKLINTDFKLDRLYQDIAVAAGTSLRFDFDYFLVRFDWAYKIKNPIYSEVNNGWFQKLKLGSGQFQLGINYPF